MAQLQGKVAFVTGAARGQGRSHALRLASEGADIIAVDICEDVASVPYRLSTMRELEETAAAVEERGRRVIHFKADVRDQVGLDEAVAKGISELGRLDIVVANAGLGLTPASCWEVTDDQWQDIIDVNLTGVWHTLKAATPALIEQGNGGSMIITGSVGALRGLPRVLSYTAAKHGLVGVMKVFAMELSPYMIRVNMVSPTNVDTDLIMNDAVFRLFRPDLERPGRDDVREGLQAKNLLPIPWVDASDITDAVLWLASDNSKFVTGVNLPIDAGAAIK